MIRCHEHPCQTMTIDVELRVQRERAAHNTGLKRSRYARAFGHAEHLYLHKTVDLLVNRFKEKEPGAFLEIGSTLWQSWIEPFPITPGSLVCINISETDLHKGIDAATRTRLHPDFHIMDAHALQFPDNSFDVVYGGGILHHLEFERALLEIRRVLKPDGVMLFREPLALNPVGALVRALTPEARTVDEQPLRPSELATCRKLFHAKFHFEQLLSVPVGVLSGLVSRNAQNQVMRSAFAVDEILLKLAPWLGPLYRVVVIEGYRTYP